MHKKITKSQYNALKMIDVYGVKPSQLPAKTLQSLRKRGLVKGKKELKLTYKGRMVR